MSEKDDEKRGDELLKRLWDMPPKPHSKVKSKRKKKGKSAKK